MHKDLDGMGLMGLDAADERISKGEPRFGDQIEHDIAKLYRYCR